MTTTVEDLLRELAPQVLGALVRRYGHFDIAEDAVQEASLAAAVQWPVDGVPQEPRPWLVRIASRKMIDSLRSERARRNREVVVAGQVPVGPVAAEDDSLVLLYMCCHPALTPTAQVSLTLRAVGGLTTAEIARAFLVPEATMAQRISRAKQRIRASGVPFTLPATDDRDRRRDAVTQTLYLIFNEGYTSSSGPSLHRVELSAEAIRLARLARRLEPDNPELEGLLALMLLTDARRPARIDADGALVPMAEQDRTRWNRTATDEGTALVTRAMSRGRVGPYQLQAAIAAVHAEAATVDDTDWPQILALYTLLERMGDNPVVTLNRAVAAAMVHGPRTGLALLRAVNADPRLAHDHRLDAVRGHLFELAGERALAREHYRAAARRTTSVPEQRYLTAKAATLA
ncbi:sigma factor-like helix-turn-helix DNA-binding protein [Virgisporangium ochraceum]